MPVYHIILFRLKPTVTPSQVTHWTTLAKNMVGQIPGLLDLKAGGPLPICVPRAKGFNMGLVAILEKEGDLQGYAVHPAHLEVHKLREEYCEETLAYDFEF